VLNEASGKLVGNGDPPGSGFQSTVDRVHGEFFRGDRCDDRTGLSGLDGGILVAGHLGYWLEAESVWLGGWLAGWEFALIGIHWSRLGGG